MKGLFQEDHWAATAVEARLGQRERVDERSRELFFASLWEKDIGSNQDQWWF